MTSEQRVKQQHPKAAVLTRPGSGWGVFLEGTPRFLGTHAGWSLPYAYGNTKSAAWVAARKKLEQETK